MANEQVPGPSTDPASDETLAESRAALRSALDAQAQSAGDFAVAELDALIEGLEDETSPPPTTTSTGSGLIDLGSLLAAPASDAGG